MKTKPKTQALALTVLPPEKPGALALSAKKGGVTDDTIARFANARHFYNQAGEAGVKLAGWLVMCGIELQRLHDEIGVKRGRKQTLNYGNSANSANVCGIKWEDAVKAGMGFSESKARYCMDLAKAAAKRVPEIRKAMLNPYKIDMAALTKATMKLCDGQTAKSLMQALGIAKADPSSNLKADRNKGGNSTKKKTTPEEDAQEYFRAALCTLMGLRQDAPEKWLWLLHHLPLDREGDETVHERMTLREGLEELEFWEDAFDKVSKAIAKALHGSRGDAGTRLVHARAKVMKEAGIKRGAEDAPNLRVSAPLR